MFIHTTMETLEYMKVRYKYLPEDIRKSYKLQNIVNSEYIYIKIIKGMYELKQAVVLSYKQVSILLQVADYCPILGSLGMWKILLGRKIVYVWMALYKIIQS